MMTDTNTIRAYTMIAGLDLVIEKKLLSNLLENDLVLKYHEGGFVIV
jgi:hypothetical protein